MNKDGDCYSRPLKIKSWDKNIDYVMFVDENENADSISHILDNIIKGIAIHDDDRYFTVTGCIFTKKAYSVMRNNIRKLKAKYWENGYYYDSRHKDTRYVCFHSREIRMHTGAFNESLVNYQQFLDELSNVLIKVDCKIISVSINLEEYILKGEQAPIYEKAFDLLLERYIYTTKNNKIGIIMLESRGKKDDQRLLNHIYEIIYKKGTTGISTFELIKKIKGVYFNPKWYGGHSSTFAGLEIADLFSYPIHQYVKYKKPNKSFQAIESKIASYPDYTNRGLKIYPREKDDVHHP